MSVSGHSELKLYILCPIYWDVLQLYSLSLPVSLPLSRFLSHTHAHSDIHTRKHECTLTHSNKHIYKHTCAHRIHRCKSNGRNKCVNNCRWKSNIPQETSRGKRERDLFFSFFTQTRNAQASAAAWVNKRMGLTSLSLGPGACARQHSLCCCQRGCWGLKNYTLQLKGCLCWSAKAFLSILQPTACHVLGGRPPS